MVLHRFTVGNFFNLCQFSLDGRIALSVSSDAVHGKAIEATDFLLERALGIGVVCELLYHFAQLLLVVFLELVKLGIA